MKPADLPVGLGLQTKPGLPRTLRDKFLVPPFSVLDARQGYWQGRKRAWLSLGLRGELGRGEGLAIGGCVGDDIDTYRHKTNAVPGGHLFPSAKLRGGRTVRGDGRARPLTYHGSMESENDASQRILGLGGTSVFDPVLCELTYAWFCPPGGSVLDPFAGGSVRGVVAAATGHPYVGVDLSSTQVAADREQWNEIGPKVKGPEPLWIVGDSQSYLATSPPEECDLVFSCPPYADLERYSDDPRDLSTMDFPRFLDAYRRIIALSVARLREDRFAVFVVGDVRGGDGFYRGLVGETIGAFASVGARLYNQAVLVVAVASLSLRAAFYFRKNRKLGSGHQHFLVFAKGNPEKAAASCAAGGEDDNDVRGRDDVRAVQTVDAEVDMQDRPAEGPEGAV